MRTIQFFFELASPYSYLASLQIERLADGASRRIDWCPIDIEVVWSAHGVLEAYSAIRQLKRSYIRLDSQRCAQALGISLSKPVTSSRDTKLAKLAYWGLLDSDRELAERFIRATWHAYFHDGKPISSAEELAAATTSLGLERDAIESMASTDVARKAQDKANSLAIAVGCFGIPWFVIDGEVFFGHDRLPHMASYLQRQTDATSVIPTSSRKK
jgi:2-hydroxychromene-2-carboxylate isomerase